LKVDFRIQGDKIGRYERDGCMAQGAPAMNLTQEDRAREDESGKPHFKSKEIQNVRSVYRAREVTSCRSRRLYTGCQ